MKIIKFFSFLFLIIISLGILCSCAGEQGPAGPQGEQGIQGEPGEDGETPEITIGEDGTSMLTGEGTPSDDLGKDGDSYIDTNTWNFYVKENGIWVLKGNIKGDSSGSSSSDHDGTEGLEFYPINKTECAVFAGIASLLDEIIIPETYKSLQVVSILNNGFKSCTYLTSIVIPEGVTSIGKQAFEDCSSLENVYYNGTIEDWCNITFEWGSNPMYFATNLYFLDENGDVEYNGNKYSLLPNELVIPNGVTEIKPYAFYGCSSLTSIIIPEGVTSIGEKAFYGCSSLTNIVIPDSVTSIGNQAFEDCSSLESITLPFVGQYADGSGATHFGYIFGASSYSYNDDCVPTSLKEVIITGGTSIGGGAFSGCSSLTSIIIPEGVTSIGEKAFYECSSLTSIVIPEGVTSIGIYAFNNCSSLTSIELPNTLESIGNYAFLYCSSLTSIIIPEGVTSIGNLAFYHCSSLTSIIIPEGVTSIGNQAFEYCSSFENVYYNGTIEDWCNITFEWNSNPMYFATNLYFLDENGDVEYNGNKYSLLQNELVIPNGVTEIKPNAFYGCSSLTSIVIPEGVTSIGNYAFSNCRSLSTIVIPEGVTSIGIYAFNNCSSLTIYCEATSKPSGWDASWNSSNRPVYWANEWEYVEETPTPINN